MKTLGQGTTWMHKQYLAAKDPVIQGSLQGKQRRGLVGEPTGWGPDSGWAASRPQGRGHCLCALTDAPPHPGAIWGWGQAPWLHADQQPPKASPTAVREVLLARTLASIMSRAQEARPASRGKKRRKEEEESSIKTPGCNLECPAGIQAAMENGLKVGSVLHSHTGGGGALLPAPAQSQHRPCSHLSVPVRPASSSLGQSLQVPIREHVAHPGPRWRLRTSLWNRIGSHRRRLAFPLSTRWAPTPLASSLGISEGGCECRARPLFNPGRTNQRPTENIYGPSAQVVKRRWKIRGLEQVHGIFWVSAMRTFAPG